MSNMKDALLRMVKAARLAKTMDDFFVEKGYAETPYTEIYGEIFEAIYSILGENTPTANESITHTMLTAPYMDDERRAACLNHVFESRNMQPKPHTIEPDEMDRMVRENGGYRYETPEGEWK